MQPDKALKIGHSISEVCEVVGVCRQKVYDAINEGSLRTFKIGRRRLVSSSAINEWISHLEDKTKAA